MQEMFEDFQNGEEWKVPVERDPFLESPDTESLVGVCEIFMKCITYMVHILILCNKRINMLSREDLS